MNRLMTAREVADALHVHVNTVKRLDSRDLPFVRVVKRGDRRYRPEDVERYLRECQR